MTTIYDPKAFALVIDKEPILSEYAEGSAIKVSMNSDTAKQTVGLYGDVQTNVIHNNTGMITIELLKTAAFNDNLSLKVALQRNLPVFPLFGCTLADRNGVYVMSAFDCYVQKEPDYNVDDGSSGVSWNIVCGKILSAVSSGAAGTFASKLAARIAQGF